MSETLTRAGYELDVDLAEDRAAFERLLVGELYDITLADFALPGFDARGALELAKVARPGTPFICVSGTIGEEATVELLKHGADDSVLKDRMERLPYAVQRAIDDRAHTETLVESERRFRSLFENLVNGYAYCRMSYDDAGEPAAFVYLEVNPAFERLTGLKNVEGRPVSEVIPGIHDLSPELFEVYGRVARTGKPETIAFDLKSLDMRLFITVYSPEPGCFVALFEDITERRQTLEDLLLGAARLRRTVEGAVEAMASHRPYRAALGIEAALEEVRSGAGTRYEAAAVAACERVFERGFVFHDQ